MHYGLHVIAALVRRDCDAGACLDVLAATGCIIGAIALGDDEKLFECVPGGVTEVCISKVGWLRAQIMAANNTNSLLVVLVVLKGWPTFWRGWVFKYM